MSVISVSLPSDGTTADVSDYNTPITTIVNEINGELDNSNIASDAAIAGSKLAGNGVTADKLSTSAIMLDITEVTTGVTVTTSETTLASVTVTVPSGGRDILIIAQHAYHTGSGAGDDATWYRIKDGSTVLNAKRARTLQTIDNVGVTLIHRVSAPSAGSHTYTYAAVNDSRSSVVAAGATFPISIMVMAI